MQKERFEQQIEAFSNWKDELILGIGAYQEFLDDTKLGSPESDLRIYEILEALRSDRITIAFVAEVATGKSELINSIFFSEYKRRLLPSEAGRTTMCPTELFYDNKADKPYVRLLPIETRIEDKSIAEYRREPIEWTTMNLNIDSADEMVEAFEEVTRVKTVSIKEAKRLALYNTYTSRDSLDDQPTEIEIPVWRHALISFPHPLLKNGLVILDTPGLNALGNEPELTLNMLPNAQAILFLLAADTGVTASELEVWQNQITGYRKKSRKGLLVVLNKIDTLWDELKNEEAIASSIDAQCMEAAELLKVQIENVFPISAQKSLLAKIKDDNELLEKSGILKLEQSLVEDILPAKHKIIRDKIIDDIGNMIEASSSIVKSRYASSRKQLGELNSLSGKNISMIELLLKRTREEQITYNKNVEGMQASRKILSREAKVMLDNLNVNALDLMVSKTRKEMQGSWTTHGLRIGMKTLFDSTLETMKNASEQADKIHKLVQAIFHKFHKEHGLEYVKPKIFSTKSYQDKLDQLHEDAERFRTSPITTMTEQHIVIKKFFISLVSYARNIFFTAHHDAELWIKSVLTPLISQIKDHKSQIEHRLETLRKINVSRDTLAGKIEELEKMCAQLEQTEIKLDGILETINKPLIASDSDQAA